MADKVLIIVESPNKCKTLKSFLPSNYTVMASVGHISEIANGGSYWNTGIEPNEGFEANFAVSPEKRDVVTKLKKAVQESDVVLVATDPDREGEAIAWSLVKFLRIPKAKCKRITYTEVTKKAVLDAIAHPRQLDEELVHASHARMKLDKLLGYRLSPIARKAINARSVGRCQSSGLQILVKREEEIRAFVPEEYGEVLLSFQDGKYEYQAKYWGERVNGEEREVKRLSLDEAIRLRDECEGFSMMPISCEVLGVERKERVSKAKQPFTTSTFQQEVSSRLGISIKKAMQCAQTLFEGIEVAGRHVGLITYMRTDSPEMSEEFKKTLYSYVKDNFGKEYFCPIPKAKKKELSQEGHECLRVTDLEMSPKRLAQYVDDAQLLKVYELIYRRTVASAMAPSVVNETIYTIGIGGHLFKMSTKELAFDGYTKVYKPSTKEDDGIVDYALKEGYAIQKPTFETVRKETKPKPRFTQATFQKELEDSGIGRPSTYASIIETILDPKRGYCVEDGKNLVPTQMGIDLAHFLESTFGNLINVEYTRDMEASLDEIARGSLTELDFLQGFYNNMEESVGRYAPAQPKPKAKVTDVKCPNCGKPMVVRTSRYGEFLGCSGYPKCKTTMKIEGDVNA